MSNVRGMASLAGSPATIFTTRGGAAAPWLMLAAALVVLTILKHATAHVSDRAPELVLVWSAAVGALALAFVRVTPTALPRFARVFLTGSAAFLALYFAIEPFAIPYAALPPEHVAAQFHANARWIGVALALAGLFRPSLTFASAMLLWLVRELHPALTGLAFSTLDIRNVAEVIAFVALGLCLLTAARARPRLAASLGLDEGVAARVALVLVTAAIGAHLGNYFWSGVAKLELDGGALSWLLDNRLADGIPVAFEKGTLPYAAWPWLTQGIYDLMLVIAVPMNVVSFAVQLAAPLAAWRRRWLIGITIAFDLFHVAVYLALGLLFWKWIALNFIIVATLLAMGDATWTRTARWTAVVFTLGGLVFFRTAHLAWYESPGLASPYFEAVLDDGQRQRLPTAFFRSASYQVSQGRIWWPGGHDHFNASIWGSVMRHDDMVAGQTCSIPARATPAAPEWGPPEAIGRFVRAHHRALLSRIDARGHADYIWLPHHHVPSPFVDDPVARLDARRIAAYIFVVESVCLGLDEGRLTRRVLTRTALPLYDVRADRMMP